MVIAKVSSKSNPDKQYEINAHGDGVVSCTCPAWKFQRIPADARTCKHIREFGVLRASKMAAALAA